MGSRYQEKKQLAVTIGDRIKAKTPPSKAPPSPVRVVPHVDGVFEAHVDSSLGPLHASVVDVSPEMAAKWLEKNHINNRPIAWRRVEAFSNDMRAGAWVLHHQAVAFGKDGTLLDGQHRLQAVVMSGCTVKMLVVRNDSGDFHDPIDRGEKRTTAMLTGLNARVVGACNLLRMLEQGYYTPTPMTVNEAVEAFERYKPLFEKLNEQCAGYYKAHSGVIAAVIWTMPTAEAKTMARLRQVLSGEMIKRGDPAFAFRGWRERNPRIGGWDCAMAAMSCIRYAIHDRPIRGVFAGDHAYRSITSRRRALKVKHTPGVDVVPTGHWGIQDRETQGDT